MPKGSCALGLGTVQWGLSYGISNQAGQTGEQEVSAILDEAPKHNVSLLDTSCQYGQAEEVLGQNRTEGFRIVTKTRSFSGSQITRDQAVQLKADFTCSLERLRRPDIEGLLIHRVDDLFLPGGDRLVAAMEELRAEKCVRRIGVSVYDAPQIDRLLRIFSPDIVQLPLNVLDQRLVKSGHLQMLKASGIEIHVRSVFLQGLLLMPMARVPSYFDPIRPLLSRWHETLTDRGLTPGQAALAFARDLPGVSIVLVGVENLQQFRTCSFDFDNAPSFAAPDLACEQAEYVNPMNWRRN